MKCTSVFLVLVACVALAVSSRVFATVLLYEPFDYSASSGSSLIGETNSGTGGAWAKVGGAQTNDPKVITGSLSYPDLPTSATVGSEAGQLNNLSAATADRIDLGLTGSGFGGDRPPQTYYYSMLLDVTSLGASSSTIGYMAGLQWEKAASASALQDAAAALCIQKTTSSSYQLGIAYKDSAPKILDSSHSYGTGTTLLVVVKFVEGGANDDDEADLFVNPDPLADEPALADASSINTGGVADYAYNTAAPGFSFGGDPTIGFLDDIASFELRNLSTTEPQRTSVDEIRVGTTWADAVGQVPEPASIGLLASLACLAGRRRRINRRLGTARC